MWSTGFFVWDKDGHEVQFVDYESPNPKNEPLGTIQHDSILYLSGQLAGGGTFGDHTLTEGYRAFIARYTDTAFMTPYVYNDTTGNGGGNGGNGGDTNDVRIVMAEDGNAFVAYPNPFRQRVNIEYSGQQPITAAYLTDIMGRTEQVELSATAPGRYTLDLTARPQAAYLLTLVTQDGHRHTVRLLKQSDVFGN
ncbi:MAG: T9SS type A sorting domain-containing protein [Bacteroidales bacterium]|nr:T9SS type A sorting domain-containing protein [Bacteroidales bacterium]